MTDRQRDISFMPTASDLAKIEDQVLKRIAADMGMIDSGGRPDFSEFKVWWRNKRKWEARIAQTGMGLLGTALALLVGWIASKIEWRQ